MRRRLNLSMVLLISLVTLNGLFPFSAAAQRRPPSAPGPKATKFEIRKSQIPIGGELYITIGVQERKIYDEAIEAWIINGGRHVIYSSTDGAGGFENEGQSLRIYDVETRRTRKILSEYFGVWQVMEKTLSTGHLALLVNMADGGLGGSYFAVVDPKRGEVFFRRWAEVIEIKGDTITLAFYRADDWETINSERGWTNIESRPFIAKPTKVKPYKTEKHDLKPILKRRVIYNRPTNLDSDAPPPKALGVKIYLWEVNSNSADIALAPAIRKIGGANVLNLTLDFLFNGTLSEEEQARGLSSSTFGMRFEGVTLRNGTALVKFSQPKNQTNYGSQGPMIFAAAIEKTARQFPTVKKVKICAVGPTMIDSELEKPFQKCPK